VVDDLQECIEKRRAHFENNADKAVQPRQAEASDQPVAQPHHAIIEQRNRTACPSFDLQLSGHIHGGQIFPFVYLTQLTYGMRTGLTELGDGRKLYVNRGAGTWGPPIRVFIPPEITLITIASANR
jgi:hypothetical protein